MIDVISTVILVFIVLFFALPALMGVGFILLALFAPIAAIIRKTRPD